MNGFETLIQVHESSTDQEVCLSHPLDTLAPSVVVVESITMQMVMVGVRVINTYNLALTFSPSTESRKYIVRVL